MTYTHLSSLSPNASAAQTPSFAIFLSHAGEDKETIARPLCQRLCNQGISVFFDVESFRLGDDCPKVMNEAMRTAPVGIFIMSPEFVAKEWPMRELLCFVDHYDRAVAADETPPLLIPVFYRLSTRDCRDPNMFDTYSSLFVEHGLVRRAMSGVVSFQAVSHALDTAATIWSIENDLGASNRDRPHMVATRESFLQLIENRVLERLGEEMPDLINKCHPVKYAQIQHQDGYIAVNMVPPNPPRLTLDYSSATTCEGNLRGAVLGDSGSRIVAVVASGKGGVGKTCAIKGLAEDVQVKRAFPDGILYIELGNDAGTSDLVEGIAKIVDRTGGSEQLQREIKGAKFVKEACEKAANWFGQRRCLFLIDDIWKLNGIDSKVLATLGLIVNANSRMVYTTRDEHFLRRADKVIKFEAMETFGELSRQMFLKHAGFEESIELDHKNEKALKYFLSLCSGLPLGFGIVGGSVWEYSRQCLNEQDALSECYRDILSHEKDLMDEEAEDYGKLPRIVDMSLQVLKERNKEVDFGKRFRALCVVQKQQSVPGEMLQKLWALDTLKETRRIVEQLANVSVVEMTRKEGSFFLKLHDLILDVATWKATEENETKSFFQKLVGNYISYDRKRKGNDGLTSAKRNLGTSDQPGNVKTQGGEKEEVVTGAITEATGSSTWCHAWWNVEDDGYIYNNICRILRRAGYTAELLRLLSKPQWIVKRMVNGGMFCVEQDLEHGEAMSEENASHCADRKEHLEMIGRAARLSARFVNNNPREVWFQLHGRLLGHSMESKLTSEFLKRMEMCAPKPWLKASVGLLEQAGGGAFEILNGPGEVVCTRVEGDEIWILWADRDEYVMHVGRYNRKHNRYEHEELKGVREERCMLHIASFLPDQRSVVTVHHGSTYGSIRVWNRHTGVCEQTVWHKCENHRSYIQFYADGTRMACEMWNHSVQLWDTLSGKTIGQPLQGHKDWVRCVAMSADGTRFVSGSCDATVRVWDAQSGDAVGRPLRGHTGALECVAISADGTWIVSGSHDKTVRVWDARSGNAVGQPLQGHTHWVNCVVLSTDGTRIVSGSSDKTVRVWDARSGNAVGQPLQGHTEWVRCIALSADGTQIVSGSSDKTMRVWDARRGNAVRQQLQGHTEWVACVAVSADGTRIVSGSMDGTVRVWDARSGKAVGQPLQGSTHSVRCVAVNADGTRIVSGSWDTTLRVWDARNGKSVGQPLRGFTRSVTCVAVSGDGTRVVSGSFDKIVCIWDAQSGKAIGQPLKGHTDSVECVAVNADGTRIVSGSRDATVRVWDAPSGNTVGQPLQGHTGGVLRVAVSADGTRVVSEDWSVLRLWAVNSHGGECVLTSRDAAWQRTIDSLALTWSSGSDSSVWRPESAEVSDGTEDGAQVVLGTCDAPVRNVNNGDVYFDGYFRSCRIVR